MSDAKIQKQCAEWINVLESMNGQITYGGYSLLFTTVVQWLTYILQRKVISVRITSSIFLRRANAYMEETAKALNIKEVSKTALRLDNGSTLCVEGDADVTIHLSRKDGDTVLTISNIHS